MAATLVKLPFAIMVKSAVARTGTRLCRLPRHRSFDRRGAPQRLQDYAIALGEAQQRGDLVRGRVRIEREFQPDIGEADGGLLFDAERAAEIEIALRADP